MFTTFRLFWGLLTINVRIPFHRRTTSIPPPPVVDAEKEATLIRFRRPA